MASVNFTGRARRLMQYFWDPEPKNDDPLMASIWCLGKMYFCTARDVTTAQTDDLKPPSPGIPEWDQETEQVGDEGIQSSNSPTGTSYSGIDTATSGQGVEEASWPSEFLDDFEARFWFTYRSQFPLIKKSTDISAPSSLTFAVRLRSQLQDPGGFTSDTGWGCMIRSGQCLIANALAMLRLGRDWRRGSNVTEERKLVSLFADDSKAPFSIHRFVQHGATACGKHPGEWFGPSATARCIQALSDAYAPACLKVYITGDGPDVYQDTLFQLANGDHQQFNPVLILAGLRLGINRVTPVYWDALKNAIELPQSIGIAGGQPSASHYFVGHQGDNFFYLDPHQTHPLLPYHEDPRMYTSEDIDSCHTRRLRRLHLEKMDPSMLLAFLIRDENDWWEWKAAMNAVKGKAILHIAAKEPQIPEHSAERESAINDVEAFDDDEEAQDEEDGELINMPSHLG